MTPSQGSVAELLAADGPAELDHAPDDRARDDDVVDGDRALAADARLERRQLDDDVVAREDAREPVLELVGRDRGEEADRAEVDADDGHARAEEPLQRAKHRPVAAEHDDEVGVRPSRVAPVLLGLVVG